MFRYALPRPWHPFRAGSQRLSCGVSTLSAIRRGIGKSQQKYNPDRSKESLIDSWRPRDAQDWKVGSQRKRRTTRLDFPPKSSRKRTGLSSIKTSPARSQIEQSFTQDERAAWNSSGTSDANVARNTSSNRRSSIRSQKSTPERDRMPIAIPYTTAASEFIYGRSVVEAALKAKRRRLYKLYIYDPEVISSGGRSAKDSVIQLANSAGVDTELLQSNQLLRKISGDHPSNGLVLEASPLPLIKCTSLNDVDRDSGIFQIARSEQSLEERDINGTQSTIPYHAGRKRFPLLLFLDGILDPGNLGGILRSAFFLGADAVILSSHGSPLTAAALKAASGAAETLPILLTRSTGSFIRSSQDHGWKFYAATLTRTNTRRIPKISLDDLSSPLLKHPVVVVLGNEGTGLWADVESKADYHISINGPRSGQNGVDSLNVSVSAALLTQAFMRILPYQTQKNQLWDSGL